MKGSLEFNQEFNLIHMQPGILIFSLLLVGLSDSVTLLPSLAESGNKRVESM
jgi:hypothetical protein